MSPNQHIFAPISRRRFLQSTGAATLGGSLLAACTDMGGNTSSKGNAHTAHHLPTLQQWYHQYNEKGTEQAVRSYAADYKQANIKISWVPGTGNQYPDKVEAALMSPDAPDIFELAGPTIEQVKAGLIEPLDDIIGEVKSDFSASDLKTLSINGKVYAIKMITDTGLLYYRKSMLLKAGLLPPITMDELIDGVKKLAAVDNKVKALYLGQDGGISALTYVAPWAAGSEFISDDNKIIFNTERTALAYEKIRELNATGGLLEDGSTFWWDPSALVNGRCAMQWSGLWAMPQISAALGEDFGVLPWPALDGQSQPATFSGGWAEMVYAKGKNVDAAKQYVKYLWIDNTQVQTDWSLDYGLHVPPRISIVKQATKLQSGPAAQAVEYLDKYGHANAPTWDTAMDQAITVAFNNIVKNNANAQSELKKAEDTCQTEMQRLLS